MASPESAPEASEVNHAETTAAILEGFCLDHENPTDALLRLIEERETYSLEAGLTSFYKMACENMQRSLATMRESVGELDGLGPIAYAPNIAPQALSVTTSKPTALHHTLTVGGMSASIAVTLTPDPKIVVDGESDGPVDLFSPTMRATASQPTPPPPHAPSPLLGGPGASPDASNDTARRIAESASAIVQAVKDGLSEGSLESVVNAIPVEWLEKFRDGAARFRAWAEAQERGKQANQTNGKDGAR